MSNENTPWLKSVYRVDVSRLSGSMSVWVPVKSYKQWPAVVKFVDKLSKTEKSVRVCELQYDKKTGRLSGMSDLYVVEDQKIIEIGQDDE